MSDEKAWFEGEYWATVSDDEMPIVCYESEERAREEAQQYGWTLVKVKVEYIKMGQLYLF